MLLEMSNIHSYYDKSHILHGVNIAIDEGEIVCLLGRNGVGKSTTLKSIIGLITPKPGSIQFRNKELVGLRPYQICRLGVGYVPEERRIFPTLTVRENLVMGIKPNQKNVTQGDWTIDKVYGFFSALKSRDKQKGGHLSGGEQQMLTIGRTLMGNPQVLLVDEPTEGLAPLIVDMVVEILQGIHNVGIPILLVEQAMDVAQDLAGRVYVMSKGEIVFQGPIKELLENHEIRQKYLEV